MVVVDQAQVQQQAIQVRVADQEAVALVVQEAEQALLNKATTAAQVVQAAITEAEAEAVQVP